MLRKAGKCIVSITVSLVLLVSTLPIVAHAESFSELGLDPIDQAETRRRIGYISPAQTQAGIEKSNFANKVMAIREKALEDPDSVTKKDIALIEAYIQKYFKDNTLDMYIPKANKNSIMANPGDYREKNLWLPGEKQINNYYCGPASAVAVLKGRNINVTQSTMAKRLGTDSNGTILGNFPAGLNYYNGTNGNRFHYALMTGPGYYTMDWAIKMTNAAISTILGDYGVVYDCHMVKAHGSARLKGYEDMESNHIYHYVAGEGFDSSDPSRRICFYYDSNNLKTNLGNRHMDVPFQTMARLTDDLGLIY